MRNELRAGIFFLGFALFVMWESFRLELGTFSRPGSGLFPFGMGIILVGLSVALLCKGWGSREPKKGHTRKAILVLFFLLVYCIFLEPLGFIIACFLLLAILFRLTKSRPWWTAIIMSLVVTSLAYLIFGVLLHVYLPRGFLGI